MQDSPNAGHDAPPVALVAIEGGASASAGQGCPVSVYGAQVGRRWALDRPELAIGRDEGCEVMVPLETVSRRHCLVTNRGSSVFAADLDSTNGTFLNDHPLAPRQESALRSGDLIRVGGAILKFLHGGDVEALYHEEVHRTMLVDGLTRAHNRRFLTEYLEREMARCRRHARPLALLLFDLDRFGRINDGFGHLTGDAVLREVAELVRPQVRREDCFARHGGEAFAVVLLETELAAARILGERLRLLVAHHEFHANGEAIPVTISVGVAALEREMREPAQLVAAADACLDAAKRAGRDRVVAAGDPPGS